MSTRLDAVCGLIPDCRLLIDVGCDHGLVAEYACKSGRAARVIASDVSAASLQKAERRLVGCTGVETRLGDGLQVLRPDERPDVIVMAGMGGGLIVDMLRGYAGGATLILSAQSETYRLRTFLIESGYRITDDAVVEDRRKFYDVLRAVPGEQAADEMQKKFGLFYRRPNVALLRKCEFDIRRLAGTPCDVRDVEEVIRWQRQ